MRAVMDLMVPGGMRVMILLAGLYCGMYHISYHNSHLRCFLSLLTVSERLNEQ